MEKLTYIDLHSNPSFKKFKALCNKLRMTEISIFYNNIDFILYAGDIGFNVNTFIHMSRTEMERDIKEKYNIDRRGQSDEEDTHQNPLQGIDMSGMALGNQTGMIANTVDINSILSKADSNGKMQFNTDESPLQAIVSKANSVNRQVQEDANKSGKSESTDTLGNLGDDINEGLEDDIELIFSDDEDGDLILENGDDILSTGDTFNDLAIDRGEWISFSTEPPILEIFALGIVQLEEFDKHLSLSTQDGNFTLPKMKCYLSHEEFLPFEQIDYEDTIDGAIVVVNKILNKLKVPPGQKFVGISKRKMFSHSAVLIVEKDTWATKNDYQIDNLLLDAIPQLLTGGGQLLMKQERGLGTVTYMKIDELYLRSQSENTTLIDSLISFEELNNVVPLGVIKDVSPMDILTKISSNKDNEVELYSQEGSLYASKDDNIMRIPTKGKFMPCKFIVNKEVFKSAIDASGDPTPSVAIVEENMTKTLIISGVQRVYIQCIPEVKKGGK